jgi:hypothetical protein
MIINTRYTEFVTRAKRVRDTIDGEYRLKQVDLTRLLKSTSDTNVPTAGYLRELSPTDVSDYNVKRNQGYINGARLFNAASRTLAGLMGMLFRVDPVWPKFKPSMEYLIDDADGAGLSLNQQSQLVAWNALPVGRHGLLSDMPRNDTGEDVTQGRVDGGFRPNIQQYTAENIVDYNESTVDGSKKLDLLILREPRVVFNANRIDREIEYDFKVYRLTPDGVTVQIYDATNGLGSARGEEMPVTGGKKMPLTTIPFSFIGSVNNNPEYDLLPLEPLVDTNLGHYQESANLRSSSYELSAAQLVISDDNYQKYNASEEGSTEIETGEDAVIVLSSGGSAAFISPDPNNISSDLMLKDEDRMVALGAQLITGGGGAETAEAARIKHASDVSVLENVSINISDAYDKMFKYCHIFMGEDFAYLDKASLNREFYDSKLTAQDIDAVVRAWQSGAISTAVMNTKLQKGKVIGEEVDLEAMNQEIEDEAGDNINFDEVTPSAATVTTQTQ